MEGENKHKAEMLFNRTKKAYEVLSDPHKRAIYDSVGEKGLRTDGWELVHRTKTPAEIREEYQRLAQAAEDRKLLQSTNPRGNVTISVNATEVFSPYDDSEMPNVEVSSMSISQSIEAPITRRDTVIMSGNLVSTNGNGSGGFVVCGRRLLNKGWLELDLGAGNGLLMAAKGKTIYNFSQIISILCTFLNRRPYFISSFISDRWHFVKFQGARCLTCFIFYFICTIGQAYNWLIDFEC